jgi:hypothetical protein
LILLNIFYARQSALDPKRPRARAVVANRTVVHDFSDHGA